MGLVLVVVDLGWLQISIWKPLGFKTDNWPYLSKVFFLRGEVRIYFTLFWNDDRKIKPKLDSVTLYFICAFACVCIYTLHIIYVYIYCIIYKYIYPNSFIYHCILISKVNVLEILLHIELTIIL